MLKKIHSKIRTRYRSATTNYIVYCTQTKYSLIATILELLYIIFLPRPTGSNASHYNMFTIFSLRVVCLLGLFSGLYVYIMAVLHLRLDILRDVFHIMYLLLLAHHWCFFSIRNQNTTIVFFFYDRVLSNVDILLKITNNFFKHIFINLYFI